MLDHNRMRHRQRFPLKCVKLVRCLLLLLVGAVAVSLSNAVAQTPTAKVDAEETDWATPTPEDLLAERERIRAAMRQVEGVLLRSPDANAWKRYLLWQSLSDALAAETDTDPERQRQALADLLGVFNRVAADFPSLDLPEFATLRAALRPRITQLNALTNDDGPRESVARRKRLATLMQAEHWDGIVQSEVAEHLRWLTDHAQPTPMGMLMPAENNLAVRVASPLIEQLTLRPEYDPTDVNECIVGTRVIGSGVTTGTGWLRTIPSANGALLEANFRGVLRTDTIGYNGPVRIYSDGQTQLTGTAVLRLTGDGLTHLATQVDAQASSQTKGIATKFNGGLDRLVKRIAERQIQKSGGKANQESSMKARKSFGEKFEREIAEQVAEGDESFEKQLRLPMLRRDLFPAAWQWQTTSDALHTRLTFDGRERPTALTRSAAKLADAAPRDGMISIAIHQSMIDNAAEGYLAGDLQYVDELLEDSSADATEDTATAPTGVAVRLDDFQPIVCVFENERMQLEIVGRQFVAGGVEYPAARISLSYRLAESEEGWFLEKDGAPQVLPNQRYARRPRFGFRGSALKAVLQPELEKSLPKRIDLKLPEDGLDEDLPEAIKRLKVVHASAHDGWLRLTLR